MKRGLTRLIDGQQRDAYLGAGGLVILLLSLDLYTIFARPAGLLVFDKLTA